MSRYGARQVVFVCSAISNEGSLINKIISADNQDEAGSLFFEEFSIKAREILGPFYKKKSQVFENTRSLKFTPKVQKSIYNDWIVDAFYLSEPENHAYLVFIKRVDEKNLPKPKGTPIVPISDLRSI